MYCSKCQPPPPGVYPSRIGFLHPRTGILTVLEITNAIRKSNAAGTVADVQVFFPDLQLGPQALISAPAPSLTAAPLIGHPFPPKPSEPPDPAVLGTDNWQPPEVVAAAIDEFETWQQKPCQNDVSKSRAKTAPDSQKVSGCDHQQIPCQNSYPPVEGYEERVDNSPVQPKRIRRGLAPRN